MGKGNMKTCLSQITNYSRATQITPNENKKKRTQTDSPVHSPWVTAGRTK